jgi:hypothetical protein
MFEMPAESGAGSVYLCLDCRIKYVNMLIAQNEMLEREHNYLVGVMEATVGLPGMLPRYPEARPVQIEAVHLNNIKVDRSTIGVLNTGNLEIVDSAVTVLRESDQGNKVAEAVLELTHAVLASALPAPAKDEALELLGGVATEAGAPQERRRPALAKALLDSLGTILTSAAALADLWDRVKPILYWTF